MTKATANARPDGFSGLQAPAVARNREFILAILQRVLPKGLVLEIASGTGEHAAFFAPKLEGRTFQPSDRDPQALASIRAWREHLRLDDGEVRSPLHLDVLEPWPIEACAAVLCINMIHIAPWEATVALMQGAGRVLGTGGVLVTYGPYRVGGEHTADSNVRFEEWLKAKDPSFGVRDVGDVSEEARQNGLSLEEQIPMPANNFSLVFRKN